jgi:hypothetical protein
MTGRWLLRAYPRAWRARYGDELSEVLRLMRRDGRLGPRARLDLLTGAAREQLRSAGLGGRGLPGALVVLCAWVAFCAGGVLVRKGSEHATAGVAFGVLVVLALVAGCVAVAGVCAALPAVARLVHSGGARGLGTWLGAAVAASVAAVVATTLLVLWASMLGPAAREGADALYAAGFVACGLVVLVAAAAWTALAVRIAARLDLPAGILRAEGRAATALAVLMAAMTLATALWWSSGVVVAVPLVGLGLGVMAAAATTAAWGARRAPA